MHRRRKSNGGCQELGSRDSGGLVFNGDWVLVLQIENSSGDGCTIIWKERHAKGPWDSSCSKAVVPFPASPRHRRDLRSLYVPVTSVHQKRPDLHPNNQFNQFSDAFFFNILSEIRTIQSGAQYSWISILFLLSVIWNNGKASSRWHLRWCKI